MMRTPEQVAADEALERAIKDVIAAYDTEEYDLHVTSWVVAVASESLQGEYACMVLPSPQPPHSVLGLLYMATSHVGTPFE